MLYKTKIVLKIVLTFPHVDKYAIIKMARVKSPKLYYLQVDFNIKVK